MNDRKEVVHDPTTPENDRGSAAAELLPADDPFLHPRRCRFRAALPGVARAISNGWLLSAEQGRVRFRCRGSRRGPRTKTVCLDGLEFLRRFLLHVLPRGFVRIRSFGLLAHRHRSAVLAKCRQLLADSLTQDPPPAMLSDEQQRAVERRCPRCHCGLLRIVAWLSAAKLLLRQPDLPPLAPFDSS